MSALLVGSVLAEEQGIYEVRIAASSEARVVRTLVAVDGSPLFPLVEIAAFLEVPMSREGRSLHLQWPPAVWSSTLYLDTREFRAAHESLAIPANEWSEREGEIFVSAAVLGRLLAAVAAIRAEELQLVISGPEFPLLKRRAFESRPPQFAASILPAREPDLLFENRSGGATAGWGVSGTWGKSGFRGSARVSLATALSGGSLEGGGDAAIGSGPRGSDGYARYSRAFAESSLVRRLELGDVRGGGVVSRPFRGVFLTNDPVYTPDYFGETLIRPLLPAGWKYEVYQGDYLLDASTSGSTPVPVPLRYGTNPLRVRTIGPAGQERIEEMTFLVPAVQLPSREWRYSLGAGECSALDCRHLAVADLRRGLTSRLTAGAGVEVTDYPGEDTRARVNGLVSFMPTHDLRMELRARQQALAHVLLQQYREKRSWNLSGGWQRPEVSAEREGVWFADGDATLRSFGGGALFLTGHYRGSTPGSDDVWQAGVVSGLRRVQAGVSWQRGLGEADVVSVTGRASVPRAVVQHLGDLTLNGRVDVSSRKFLGTSLQATALAGHRLSVTAGLEWRDGTHSPEATLALLVRTRAAYLHSSSSTGGGSTRGFVSAGGGLAMSGQSILFDPFESVERSGVRGVVFVDRNGNSKRDDGEPGVSGVPVSVGGDRTLSDRDGIFRVRGLLPYTVVAVAVDPATLPETNLTPVSGEKLVRLTPNVDSVLEIPLVVTSEVSGHVRWASGFAAGGGISVEAAPAAGGAAFRVLTFSDGEYYFANLPAGEYSIRVAVSSANTLGAENESMVLTVPAEGAGRVSGPVLVLNTTK